MTDLGPRPPQSIFSGGPSREPVAQQLPDRPVPVSAMNPTVIGGALGSPSRAVLFDGARPEELPEQADPRTVLDPSRPFQVFRGTLKGSETDLLVLPFADRNPDARITIKVAHGIPGPLLRTQGYDLIDDRDRSMRLTSGLAATFVSAEGNWWRV
jgi:hypothetical protein